MSPDSCVYLEPGEYVERPGGLTEFDVWASVLQCGHNRRAIHLGQYKRSYGYAFDVKRPYHARVLLTDRIISNTGICSVWVYGWAS
jgi:hypothetical protein